ncbi:MAG: sulfotransferase [Deltaproteobacteria bacterium]|nr:sulfotransferase [Deltaproteobacteria bacterium]
MAAYKRPVFIVGMPRSGTTLIQGILCNTREYFPMPETHFFVWATYGLPEENINKAERKSIQNILLRKSRIKLDKGLPEYLTTTKGIFEHVIDQFNPEGRRTFLEKTPRHIFFYSKILEYYPDAKFICMVREPKNMISSQLTTSPQRTKSVIRLSLFYNKIAAAIMKIRKNNNTFLIKYEDLTIETEPILRHTCEFLNISFDSKLVDNVAAPVGIVSEHEYWKSKNIEAGKIKKNNPDKWKEAIDNNQENLVNFITKSYAAQFGYTLENDLNAVFKGFSYDIKKLLRRKEFKKVFKIAHG